MRLWYGRNFVVAVIVFATATLRGADVFVECESFDNLGGWVVDSYSMRSMGSAYVMAHGCGKPVADAVGTVSVPAKGTYTAWARTRNWNAEWTKGAAGRFKVKVNGADLPGTLGVGDGSWSWCKVGEVSLPAGRAEIALHDLTGFNGRCDALFLTTAALDERSAASAAEKARAVRRGKVENDREEWDMVVVGGGVAGCCAALSASRYKLKTLLLQDRADRIVTGTRRIISQFLFIQHQSSIRLCHKTLGKRLGPSDGKTAHIGLGGMKRSKKDRKDQGHHADQLKQDCRFQDSH